MAPLCFVFVGLIHLLTNAHSAPLTGYETSERISLLNIITQKKAPTLLEIDRLTAPTIENRFDFDDKRRNWGLLINGSIYDENDNTNYGYRPITIPRLSPNNPLLLKENIVPKTLEISVPFKAKRFLDKTSEVNGVVKVMNNEPKKIPSQCDIARTKCCFNKFNLNNCSRARECFKLEDISALCDPTFLQEVVQRLLNLYD